MRQKNIKNGKLLEAYYLNKIFHIIESYQRTKKHYAGMFFEKIQEMQHFFFLKIWNKARH